MATTPGRIRPWRYLAAFAGIVVVLYALVFFTGDGKPTPKLGIDLQGGTRVTLVARTVDGGAPPRDQLVQAQQIIEQRVNGLGVSGAEVVLDGDNITITVPGDAGEQARSLGQTAQLRFRPVIGQPVPAAPAPAPPAGTAPAPGAPAPRPPSRRPAARRPASARPAGRRRPGPPAGEAGRVLACRCRARAPPRPRSPALPRSPPRAGSGGRRGDARRPAARQGDRGREGRPAEHRPDHPADRAADARLQQARPAHRLRRPGAPARHLQPGRHRQVRARPVVPGGHADRERAGGRQRPGRRLRRERHVQERGRGDLGQVHDRAHRRGGRVHPRRQGRVRAHDPGRDLRLHRDLRPVQPGAGAEPRRDPALRVAAAVVRVERGADRLGHARASRRWRPG